MRMLLSAIAALFLVQASALPALASKPLKEKSAEACEKLLSSSSFAPRALPSPSTLIPMSLVIKAAKQEFLAKTWRWAVPGTKQFPTAGLAQMYRTAETAADALVTKIGSKNTVIVNKARNPYDAAVETLKLVRSESPPEYIRNAVFIRDNVVVVVPILKRVSAKNAETGLPEYTPIITKGHQELAHEDVLAAAFAGWAMEPWLKQIPEEAFVYLQPMAKKRARSKTAANTSNEFKIDVKQYQPEVRELAERFFAAAEEAAHADQNAVDTATPERRNKALEQSPWSEFGKARLAKAEDISMMPNPPEETLAERLRALGYGTLESLAALDPKSDRFIEVAVASGLSARRLRYFVAHAAASHQNKILLLHAYEDPMRGAKTLVHVDFEDMLSRRLRSGVYLFGVEIQDVSGEAGTIEKKFIFSKALEQPDIEQAWADFFTFLKKHPKLKSADYVITTYSKHELVKFEQEFDILKQPAAKFSAAERKSEFYSELDTGEKTVGRLIRHKEFFKNHPGVKPADVFDAIDRMVDLLDVVRADFAFPGYTNSIKHVLKHLGHDLYGPGRNGLESIAWAKEAYATGEDALFKRIQDYNENDIDGNRFVSDFLRSHVGRAPETTVAEPLPDDVEAQVERAVKLRELVVGLENKRALLEAALGGVLLEHLNRADLKELYAALDRQAYLEDRKETKESEDLNDDERQAVRQRQKFEHDEQRSAALYAFFARLNPDAVAEGDSPSRRAAAQLLAGGSNFLLPNHIQQMLVLEELRAELELIAWTPAAGARDRLELPAPLKARLDKFDPLRRKLWSGLYYSRAYSLH